MEYYLLRRLDRYTIEPDYLPISYLEAYCYCPRLFWYVYTFKIGCIGKATGDLAKSGRWKVWNKRDIKMYRQVRVFSSRLRIVGYTDLVEDELGRLQVVEYLENESGYCCENHVQLCAKALCLEDTMGRDQVAPFGELFDGVADRRQIIFTGELRRETELVIRNAFSLLASNSPPCYSKIKARCKQCSLYHICYM
ncbi:MAG: CRISPR-associated protein Cas4 [Anaerolineales bacterium]|nr:CRISPR-associated protein Cas4 [Anaerolineales bacterium]